MKSEQCTRYQKKNPCTRCRLVISQIHLTVCKPKNEKCRNGEKISDEVFIQPVVVTGAKDKAVKIALDARSLNIATLKEKYQVPNLDKLMKQLAKIIKNENDGESRFTSLDLLYAYDQTELQPETGRHCNFQVIGIRDTKTYAFYTGYYEITTLLPEFQKILDDLLLKIRNNFAFRDDILIVTKGKQK